MKRILLLMVGLVLTFGCFAKTANTKESYNMKRAAEQLEVGDFEGAEEFLEKELKENPKNGYAYFMRSLIHGSEGDYSSAFEDVNKVIKLVPKKDNECLGLAYQERGKIYLILGDSIQGLADYGEAIKINPRDGDAYESRAQLYYELGQYDESDADYNAMTKVDPSNVIGYMGLGRNAYVRGNYEEAIKLYDKMIKIDSDYSGAYTFRADPYIKLGRYVEAADDVIKAISIDNDYWAVSTLLEFPAEQTTLLTTKLKGMAARNPHEALWPYYMAMVYDDKKMYEKAIEAYDQAYRIDAHPSFITGKIDCYENLGEYAKAYELLIKYEQLIDDEEYVIQTKAGILGEGGDVEGAIMEWCKLIERHPDYYGVYYMRAFYEDNSNQTEAALEDYNMAIILDPNYAYSWLGKGDMHLRRGEREEAIEAYKRVVELDTVPGENSCAMFALLHLNRKDEAIDFMNRLIESDPEDSGHYYDAACLYSRIGDLDKAMGYLRTAFEKGFRRYNHLMRDDDLEALRETEGFKQLMKEFGATGEVIDFSKIKVNENESTGEVGDTTSNVEVHFTPTGGCYSVKCNINELPLSFIFDTGASTVSISQVEANFMLKNGYLHKNDFIGKGRFVDANGDISEGSIINLREVEIGGLKLNNVQASVVSNQKAPLLLGQSVLSRLGTIKIDNSAQKLIISR